MRVLISRNEEIVFYNLAKQDNTINLLIVTFHNSTGLYKVRCGKFSVNEIRNTSYVDKLTGLSVTESTKAVYLNSIHALFEVFLAGEYYNDIKLEFYYDNNDDKSDFYKTFKRAKTKQEALVW